MEFLIEITADLDAVRAADRERLLAEERTVAFELKRSGTIKHMWRVHGRPATVSVWEAADAAELEQLVARLPLRRWLSVETTPLDEHYLPNFPPGRISSITIVMSSPGTADAPDAFRLTPEQAQIRETATRLARERYRPKAEAWDLARTPFPLDERRLLGELSFLGISLPERFGGLGLPLLDSLLVIEELAKECRPAAFQVFESNTGPAQVINLLGTEEQRARFLPDVVSGESTIALAISEPDAGSAATDMRTTARRDGDRFILDGTKRWISNGGHAERYLVYTRLSDAPGSKGIGAIIVDADTPGLSFGAQEKLLGFRGIPSADLIFEGASVPAENLLVGPGEFRRLFSAFSIERLGNSTMSLAIGQAALDRTVAYVCERVQFGKSLVEFQSVQLMLADMMLQVEAARLLIQRAAIGAGSGLPDPFQVSLAKCTANEMAKRVSDMAMQLHGGNGYTEEYGIERLHRDAHGWAIAGGTPTMQRIRIVSEALQRNFDQRR